MNRLSNLFLAAFLFLPVSGSVAQQAPSSGDWVSYRPFKDSPDQAFIREMIASSEDHQMALSEGWLDIEDISVGYIDLNGDGVDELIVAFYEVSFFYCGNDGCPVYFYEKRGGAWQMIGYDFLLHLWVGSEAVQGYRTIYTADGLGMIWDGKKYECECIGWPPGVTLSVGEVSNKFCKNLYR